MIRYVRPGSPDLHLAEPAKAGMYLHLPTAECEAPSFCTPARAWQHFGYVVMTDEAGNMSVRLPLPESCVETDFWWRPT